MPVRGGHIVCGVWAAVAAVVLRASLCAAGPLSGATAPAPPAVSSAAADKFFTEGMTPPRWKATVQDSFDASQEAWTAELASVADDWLRDRRLRTSLSLMLMGSLERFPDATSRGWTLEQLAAQLTASGHREEANACLKRLIDQWPGEVDRTSRALTAILQTDPDATVDGDRWLSYAVDRVLALDDIGVLPPESPLLQAAWRARLAQARRHGMYWQAQKAAEVLARFVPAGDPWPSYTHGTLLAAAGRTTEAMAIFRRLSPDYPGVRSQLSRPGVDASAKALDYPRSMSLESRWGALRTRQAIEGPALAAFLAEAAADDGLVPLDASRRTAAWVALDQQLRSNADLAALVAGATGPSVLPPDDVESLTPLLRRFPFNPIMHQAALRCGEMALRHGQTHLAWAMFQDVLGHSSDRSTRASAQAGIWMAMSAAGAAPRDIQAAVAQADPDGLYPWLGQATPARAIASHLAIGGSLEAQSQSQAPRLVQAPPQGAWTPKHERGDDVAHPLGQITDLEGLTALAGADLLAVYGQDLRRPLWSISAPAQRPADRRSGRAAVQIGAVVPGEIVPVRDGSRLFARWGRDRADRYFTDVVAFDADSGAIVWSTETQPQWDSLMAAADPVLADGRLYVLAASEATVRVPLFLVCLQAQDGRVLWRRQLGILTLREREPQLVFTGNAVTVDGPRVFGSTSAGMFFACDVRDGTVLWERTYPGVRMMANTPRITRRQGMSPQVAAGKVVFAPRDYPGVLALNVADGTDVWDNWAAPSERFLGVCDGLLLFCDEWQVAAVDTAAGHIVWSRQAPAPLTAACAAGRRVWLAAGPSLMECDAGTGVLLSTRQLDAWAWELARTEQGPLLLTDESAWSSAPASPRPTSAPAASLSAAPLKLAWELDRPGVKLLSASLEVERNSAPCVLTLCRGMIECVELAPQPTVIWSTAAPQDLVRVLVAHGKVLAMGQSSIIGLDARTGRTLWRAEVELNLRWGWRRGSLLICELSESNSEALAAIDIASGKTVWERRIKQINPRMHLRDCGADGDRAYVLVGLSKGPNQEDARLLGLDLLSGGVGSLAALPNDTRTLWVSGGSAFCFAGGKLCQFPPDNPAKLIKYDLPPPEKMSVDDVELASPWIIVRMHLRESKTCWVLREGDPKVFLKGGNDSALAGGKLVDFGSRGATITDVITGQKVVCDVPVDQPKNQPHILDWRLVDGALTMLEGRLIHKMPKGTEARVKARWFDASGKLLGESDLPQVMFRPAEGGKSGVGAEIAVGAGVLVVADLAGLHAYMTKN